MRAAVIAVCMAAIMVSCSTTKHTASSSKAERDTAAVTVVSAERSETTSGVTSIGLTLDDLDVWVYEGVAEAGDSLAIEKPNRVVHLRAGKATLGRTDETATAISEATRAETATAISEESAEAASVDKEAVAVHRPLSSWLAIALLAVLAAYLTWKFLRRERPF